MAERLEAVMTVECIRCFVLGIDDDSQDGRLGAQRTQNAVEQQNRSELASSEVPMDRQPADQSGGQHWIAGQASRPIIGKIVDGDAGGGQCVDLGRIADNGVLVLAGRSKEVIISGGANIYPIEVEDVLLAHPDVVEAAVIGVPDSEWGEIVVAYIVAADNRADLGERLDRHCLENLARFKRPKRYRLVRELPKNAYGKVVKRSLLDGEPSR